MERRAKGRKKTQNKKKRTRGKLAIQALLKTNPIMIQKEGVNVTAKAC